MVEGWRGYMYDNWNIHETTGGSGITKSHQHSMTSSIINVDQQMQNLRSNALLHFSITGDGDGPLVYLDHGALCWCGYAGIKVQSPILEHKKYSSKT
jgi:hypothetical protein